MDFSFKVSLNSYNSSKFFLQNRMKTKATLQVSKIHFRRDELHFTFVECSKTSKSDPFFLTNVKKCIFVTSASAVKKKKKSSCRNKT